ncbi:DegT/DnrJ/EryC1/StrS family aminotransferase [Fodinibius sediminis]|uniref:dTDP-4-amino-4,6-dideoxygalactose transaminase n=1 Tax=Fodinibius sediminis TaxID=1214077 RepID=A0A521CTE6_9BACT|nr:DegT/DnrJ/EryC1/StrS family aminotransferase [Fodinibius sediminis]SMO62702.1 dTDP-4-amino-4,6-dideoxygalactose transaminase [Fodinibius sediminis]
MEKKRYTRREFLKKNSIAGLGAAAALALPSGKVFSYLSKRHNTPALLGGEPVISPDWPSWPIWKPQQDEERLLDVIRSGVWSRDEVVTEFEQKWAELMGTKRCLTVVNGTNALNTSLAQLDIGWGDEVLVTPYTFIASVSCIVFNGAIPVFVDIDPDTFQMDPDQIEDKITANTKAILPVHIAGLPSDMVRIMDIARKHDLLVVEDACQAWMAEINGQKVSTFGDAGCFSFQNSKNLPMGEGGAIVSDNEEFMDRCRSYHNYGNPYGSVGEGARPGTYMVGTKLRLTEYQAAIGLAQLKRLEEQTRTRSENARYLRDQLEDIPGITPARLYPSVTRAAYHLFPFRYHKEEFQGLPRSRFLKALRAEGVPCSSGYNELNKMPFLENAFNSSKFRKIYSEDRLDYEEYAAENQCPSNEKICNEEAVWFTQNILLGSRNDMDLIAGAIDKIHKNAESLK